MDINIKFLGNSKISINKETITISQNKPKAVLFYILYKKYCTRDEIITIFWPNLSINKGRLNLRSVLHKLRDKLKYEIIISSGNDILKINEKYNLIQDIDMVLDTNNTKYFEFDDFIFMRNHGIKNCPEFDEWVNGIREAYRNLIVNNILFQLKNSYDSIDNTTFEKICKRIIDIDICNEKAYRYLINLKIENFEYEEALKLYYTLESELRKLDEKPEEETELLLKKINEKLKLKKKFFNNGVLIHTKYLNVLQKEITNFINSEKFKNIILFGEMGTGKNKLIKTVINDTGQTLIIEIKLNQNDIDMDFSCFCKIFENIDFDMIDYLNEYNEKEESKFFMGILNKFEKVFFNKKIIIFIDNFEYIDLKSLKLLNILFFNDEQKDFFIICSHDLTTDSGNIDLNKLKIMRNILIFEINNLSYDEFEAYYYSLSKDNNNSLMESNENILKQIYNDSQGNLMILNYEISKYFKNFKIKENYFINKISEINLTIDKNQKFILELLSLTEEGLPNLILDKIISVKNINYNNLITNLLKRKIIVIYENFDIFFVKIKYKILRNIFFKELNFIVKENYSRSIINSFEENKIFFKQRYILYFIKSNIHFSEFFEDKILNLKNQLIYLEYQLNYFDEFYPQLNSYTDEQFNSFINKKFIYEKFDFIENSLNKYIINSDVFSLFIKLYYLKGRSLIRDGYNNEGQIYIDKLLLNSKKEDEKYKILGLFEKVYLGLRLQNLDIINKYLKKLTDNKEAMRDNFTKAKIYRLQGLYFYLEKEYFKAIEKYKQSLNLLENMIIERNNICNISAIYNYLAICYCELKDFKNAEIFHEKALSLCKKYNFVKTLDEFYKDYAYTMYIKGNYKKSESLCLDSIKIYEQYTGFWERSMVYNILSLINISKGNLIKAKQYHKNAEIFITKSPSKKEIFINECVEKKMKEYSNIMK